MRGRRYIKRAIFIGTAMSLLIFSVATRYVPRHVLAQTRGCNSDTYIETTHNLPINSDYAVFAYAKSSANATLYIGVDGSDCVPLSVPSSSWAWAKSTSAVFNDITAGSHTVRIFYDGNSVDVDKVVFTSDTTCNPSSTETLCIEETPSMEIQGVRQGELVTENRKVSAVLSGTGDIDASVEFYLDDELVSTTNTEPYCMYEGSGSTCGELDFKEIGNGQHEIKVILSNGDTSIVEKNVVFTVSDPTPIPTPQPNPGSVDPVITVQGVSEGATINGQATISATISNSQNATVKFILDSTLMNASSLAPYCMVGITNGSCKAWDSTSVPNGAHTLYISVEGTGLNAKMYSYGFTVNNQAPVVVNPTPTPTPTVPVDGQPSRTTGTVNLSTPSTTPTNSTVRYSVDGNTVASTTPKTAALDTTKLTNGTHTVSATVSTANGEKKTYTSTMKVDNGKLVTSKSWIQKNKFLAFLIFILMSGVLFGVIVALVRFIRNRRMMQMHNIGDTYQYVQPQELSMYQQAGVAVVAALLIGIVPLMARGTSFAAGGRGFIEEAETMTIMDASDEITVKYDSQQNLSYIHFEIPETPTPDPTPTPTPDPDPTPSTPSDLANPFIGGYIEMWGDVQPGNVPADYDMLFHAFASVTYDGTAVINEMGDRAGIAQQYKTRNAAGKPSILSIGGFAGAQAGMTSDAQIQNFISSVIPIIDEFGFSGIDWDLEFDIPGGLSGEGMADASRQLIQHYGDGFLITLAPFEGIEDEYKITARLLGDDLTAVGYQFYNMRSRVTADIIKSRIQEWINDADITQNQFAIGFCQEPGNNQAIIDESEMAQMYSEVEQTYPNVRGTWVWGIHYIDNVRGFRFAPTMRTVVN